MPTVFPLKTVRGLAQFHLRVNAGGLGERREGQKKLPGGFSGAGSRPFQRFPEQGPFLTQCPVERSRVFPGSRLRELFVHSLGAMERGQVFRKAVQGRLPEGFLLLLQRFPPGVQFPDRAFARAAENMRMPANEFLVEAFHHVLEVERASLAGQLGVKRDLEKDIAQFLLERRHVPGVDGLQDLVGFLQQVGFEASVSLAPVPGTSPGGPKAGHQAFEAFERVFTFHRVASGKAIHLLSDMVSDSNMVRPTRPGNPAGARKRGAPMPFSTVWKDLLLKVPLALRVANHLKAQGHSQEESEVGGVATAFGVIGLSVLVFNVFLLGILRSFFSEISRDLHQNPAQLVIVVLLITLLCLGVWFRFLGRREAQKRSREMSDFRENERRKEMIAAVRRGAMGHFREAFEGVLKERYPQLRIRDIHVTDTHPRIRFHARKKGGEVGESGDKSYLLFRERLFEDTRDVIDAVFEMAPNVPVVTVDALLNLINRKAQFYDGPVLSVRAKREVWKRLDTAQPDAFRLLSALEVRYNDGAEVEAHPDVESRGQRVVERLKSEMPQFKIRYETQAPLEADDWRRAADPQECFITELSSGAELGALPFHEFETVLVKLLRRHGFDVPKARSTPGPQLEMLAYHPHPLLGGSCLVVGRQIAANAKVPVEMVADLDARVRAESRQRGLYFVTGGFTDEASFRGRSLRVTLVDRAGFLKLAKWDADPARRVDAYGATDRKFISVPSDLSALSVPALTELMGALLSDLGFSVEKLGRLQGAAVKAVATHAHPVLGGKVAVLARLLPEKQPVDEETVREFLRVMEAEFCTRGFLFLPAYLTPKARALARTSGVDTVERADWMNLLQLFKAPGEGAS